MPCSTSRRTGLGCWPHRPRPTPNWSRCGERPRQRQLAAAPAVRRGRPDGSRCRGDAGRCGGCCGPPCRPCTCLGWQWGCPCCRCCWPLSASALAAARWPASNRCGSNCAPIWRCSLRATVDTDRGQQQRQPRQASAGTAEPQPQASATPAAIRHCASNGHRRRLASLTPTGSIGGPRHVCGRRAAEPDRSVGWSMRISARRSGTGGASAAEWRVQFKPHHGEHDVLQPTPSARASPCSPASGSARCGRCRRTPCRGAVPSCIDSLGLAAASEMIP